jgi:hypothetical protein
MARPRSSFLKFAVMSDRVAPNCRMVVGMARFTTFPSRVIMNRATQTVPSTSHLVSYEGDFTWGPPAPTMDSSGHAGHHPTIAAAAYGTTTRSARYARRHGCAARASHSKTSAASVKLRAMLSPSTPTDNQGTVPP